MSIESVRWRLDAATPGPWAGSPGRIYGAVVRPGLSNGNAATDAAHGGRVVGESMGDADAALIAHAPTDLALLLAVADAAKAEHYRYTLPAGTVVCACSVGKSVWLAPSACPVLAALDALEAAE